MNRRIPEPLLQIAVDVSSTKDALALAEKVYPHYDIMEVGTPLIIEEGLSAVEALKSRFPDKRYLADLKIMDAGDLEGASAFRRGADIVTVLAVADNKTIEGVLSAASRYGGLVMADLINCANPVDRAEELQRLGVPIVCFHTAFDVQGQGRDPMAGLKDARLRLICELAIAGGLGLNNCAQAAREGADIIIVGGAVINAADPGVTARELRDQIGKARA